MATTTSMTSTYAGEAAGQYIAAALFSGVTLGSNAITIKPNIKYKQVVKKLALSGLLQDASCDFTDAGTVTLTERIIEPKELMMNVTLCKSDFDSDWEAISMGYSAFDNLPPNFQSFLIAEMGAVIAEGTETSIWMGATGTSGQFDGLVTLMLADSTVVDSPNDTVTSTNVIAELTTTVDLIPARVRNAPDLTFYVAPNIYYAYSRALGGFVATIGGAGYKDEGSVNLKPLMFEGIPMFIAEGLSSNYAVVAQKSNLWFGTGLLSDQNEIKIIDMADIDGSKNVRFVARYTAAVQYGIGSEIVLYAPAH